LCLQVKEKEENLQALTYCLWTDESLSAKKSN
jgi:hypothetical protein